MWDRSSPALAAIGRAAHATSRDLEGLHKNVDHARESIGDFKREVIGIGAAMLGVGGLVHTLHRGVEEVSAFETQTKSLAGVMSQAFEFEKGASEVDKYRISLGFAQETLEDVKDAGLDMGQTMDTMTRVFQKVAVATTGLGMTRKEVVQLTESATALGVALGDSPEMAAEAISKALVSGRIAAGGVIGKWLRTEFSDKELAGFKKNRPAFLAEIQKRTAGMREVAVEMNQTLAGSAFKAADAVGDALRAIIAPTATSMTGMINDWTKSVSNWAKGDQAKVWARELRGMFEDVKIATGWIADHWKEIAIVWAGMKAAGMAEGLQGGAGAMGGILGKLGAFGTGLGQVTSALGALYVAGSALADWMDKRQGAAIRSQSEASAFLPMAASALSRAHMTSAGSAQGTSATREAIAQLKQIGGVSSGGKVDREAVRGMVNQLSIREKEKMAYDLGYTVNTKNLAGTTQIVDRLVSRMDEAVSRNPEALGMRKLGVPAEERDLKQGTTGLKPKIQIGKIEIVQKFDEADPDRIFMRFKDGLEEMLTRPSQGMFNPAGAD